MIKEKKITVNIAFSKGPNLNEGSEHYLRCIYTDKARFLQIMLNFMSNAIKFTPEGGKVCIETVVKETQDIRKREKSGDKAGDNVNNKGSDLDNKSIKKIKNEFEMMTAKRCLTPRVRQDDHLNGGMIKS
jgi:K+-sensing histidine kinase KdpD